MALDTAKKKTGNILYRYRDRKHNSKKVGKTLFVVGVRSAEEIEKLAVGHKSKNTYISELVKSFVINNEQQLKPWYEMIKIIIGQRLLDNT